MPRSGEVERWVTSDPSGPWFFPYGHSLRTGGERREPKGEGNGEWVTVASLCHSSFTPLVTHSHSSLYHLRSIEPSETKCKEDRWVKRRSCTRRSKEPRFLTAKGLLSWPSLHPPSEINCFLLRRSQPLRGVYDERRRWVNQASSGCKAWSVSVTFGSLHIPTPYMIYLFIVFSSYLVRIENREPNQVRERTRMLRKWIVSLATLPILSRSFIWYTIHFSLRFPSPLLTFRRWNRAKWRWNGGSKE